MHYIPAPFTPAKIVATGLIIIYSLVIIFYHIIIIYKHIFVKQEFNKKKNGPMIRTVFFKESSIALYYCQLTLYGNDMVNGDCQIKSELIQLIVSLSVHNQTKLYFAND